MLGAEGRWSAAAVSRAVGAAGAVSLSLELVPGRPVRVVGGVDGGVGQAGGTADAPGDGIPHVFVDLATAAEILAGDDDTAGAFEVDGDFDFPPIDPANEEECAFTVFGAVVADEGRVFDGHGAWSFPDPQLGERHAERLFRDGGVEEDLVTADDQGAGRSFVSKAGADGFPWIEAGADVVEAVAGDTNAGSGGEGLLPDLEGVGEALKGLHAGDTEQAEEFGIGGVLFEGFRGGGSGFDEVLSGHFGADRLQGTSTVRGAVDWCAVDWCGVDWGKREEQEQEGVVWSVHRRVLCSMEAAVTASCGVTRNSMVELRRARIEEWRRGRGSDCVA